MTRDTIWKSALRVATAVHVAAATAYWLMQPRGFEFGSRSFLEHQILVPAVVGASIAAAAGRRPAIGVLAGFWLVVGTVVGVVGSTVFARGLLLFALAAGMVVLHFRIVAGPVAGAALGGAFLWCTWAPPATTRPVPYAAVEPTGALDGIEVRGRDVVIETGTRRIAIQPALEFDAAAEHGLWTLFESRAIRLPPWTVQRTDGALQLRAGAPEMSAEARVWRDGDGVHVRCATTLKRDVASHLSSAVRVAVSGGTAVRGRPWRSWLPPDRMEFVAFRGGRIELLRARSMEKGPFETLGSWEPHDPVIDVEGMRVGVIGWAEQASRAASPTAGWGVSQGAIEHVGGEFIWSLASTSVGRGWHSVRTARGTYVFEVVVGR